MNIDFLAHYGVQGQKWGERRYQNPDGSLTPEGRRHYGLGDYTGKTSDDIRKEINRANLENRYANAMVRSKTQQNAKNLVKNVFGTVSKVLNTSAAYGTASANIAKEDLGIARKLNDANAQQYFTDRMGSAKDFANKAKIGSQGANVGKNLMDMNFDDRKIQRVKKDLGRFSDEELKKMVERAELERKYDDDVKNKKFNDTVASINGCLTTVGSVVGIAAAALSMYTTLSGMKKES